MSPLLATFLLILGFSLFAHYLITQALRHSETEAERRVRKLIREELEGTQFELPQEQEEKPKKKRREGAASVNALASRLERWQLLHQGEGKTFLEWLDEQLIVAGIRDKMTPYQALAAALLVWAAGVIFPTFLAIAGVLPKVLYAIVVILFALYPPLKLRQLKAARQDQLKMELPVFIQQLRMMLSTGMTTIDDAIARVVRNTKLDPYDSELAREFEQAQIEYRLGGVPREDALLRIGERTQVPSVRSLVDVIITGIRTGAPMENVLAEYGHQAQETWRQDSRAYMARKEPLITIGVVITMFGGFILFAAPLVLNLIQTLSSV